MAAPLPLPALHATHAGIWLADGHGGMRAGISIDGVHPNATGYAIMEPLAVKAIDEALARE